MKLNYTFLMVLVCVYSCKNNKNTLDDNRGVTAKNGMIVSARAEASKIGVDILKLGGNAFDAMIATELALAVCYPMAGNLGGGGFMVFRKANGDIGSLDYREKAPLAATKNMFLSKNGTVIKNKSTLGAMSVAVPGTIAGIFEVHKKFGTLPIETLLQPAIDLAKKGVIVTTKQEHRIKRHQPLIDSVNTEQIVFNKNWKSGDYIIQNALAETLIKIQKNGKDEFYQGDTAKKIASFIQKNGGIITEEDLRIYKPKWRKPITFNYDDLKIISMGPPSSGGICLGQIMTMIAPFHLDTYGHNTLKTIQIITEAEKRAYADRSFYLGDPDFVKIPTSILLNASYLNGRMRNFSFEKATDSKTLSHGNIEINESMETTHYSIVDQFGNAIAVTTTLNGAYGSKLYAQELGFFFNNQMDDFSSKPGIPNMFGLTGGAANSIAPEKRMLSSMTPTIIEKNGALFMVIGTPGGSTIITSVLQTILNVHEFKMTMQDAVNAPRFHHQWLPEPIFMEPNAFDDPLINKLKKLGYTVTIRESKIIGKVDAILVLEDNTLEGGADHRGDDTAIGF